MRAISWLVVLGLVSSIAVLSACQPVSEPWDNRDYFAQERHRDTEQQLALRNRLAHTQGEYESGAHVR